MMLWSLKHAFQEEPFESESELESAVIEATGTLFGQSRIYLDVKKKIGAKGKTQNIPDGYLLDLSSPKEPRIFVVEVELARHDPLKHVAVQILEFSLSFETSPQQVKQAVKSAILSDDKATEKCQQYAGANGYDNIDFLLEKMIFSNNFNALVIIDELPDELETVLISRFKFPVEVATLQRFRNKNGEILYQFEPFLEDVAEIHSDNSQELKKRLDISEIDTIVVPARDDGFRETFLGENCWYAIRIHPSMLSRIKYVAAYRVAPESAISHVAPVESIKQWKDSNKYILYFSSPPVEIGPIKLLPKGRVRAPQAPRYTSHALLQKAKNLDEAF
jgi:hypothetical protein